MLMARYAGARIAVLTIAALVIAACGSRVASGDPNAARSDQAAQDACQADALPLAERYAGAQTTIAAAFRVSTADIIYWQETRHGASGPRISSNWRGRGSDTDSVDVCYLDGIFAGFPTDPAGTTPPPPYDRLIVLVDKFGTATVDAAGYQALLIPTRPARPTP